MPKPIPGPKGSFLTGNLKEFKADSLALFERCRYEFGVVASFRLGPRRLILVSEPDLIEEVLVTQNKSFRKHFAARLLRPVLGNGLLLSEGATWLRQRRLVQPAFSRRFVQDFSKIVLQHTDRLAQDWRRQPRRDLYHDMTKLTVDIAAHAFLGVSDTGDTAQIGDCLEVLHSDFEYRLQQPWCLPRWIPTARNRRLQKAIGRLTSIIDRMISQRQHDCDQHHDALSLLLQARDEDGNSMPIQSVRDEVMTLLLAGHDTTANGLTWTWTLLANHPGVIATLCEEVGAVKLETVSANELLYAQRIVKESMRLLPPVYLFGREALQNVSLGDYQIHKGDTVVMSQWVVHRDPRFFDDPLDFSPSRWTPEFEQALPKYAYFPFGGGPRICIGKHVAMAEATLILADLARQFEVQIDDDCDLTPWPAVTLRPKNAITATVRAKPSETIANDPSSSSDGAGASTYQT